MSKQMVRIGSEREWLTFSVDGYQYTVKEAVFVRELPVIGNTFSGVSGEIGSIDHVGHAFDDGYFSIYALVSTDSETKPVFIAVREEDNDEEL